MFLLGYEKFRLEPGSETNGTIKSNLPYDALVVVTFDNNSYGSSVLVYSDDNFSSNDSRVAHGIHNSPFTNENLRFRLDLGGTNPVFSITSGANKGANIKYAMQDGASGIVHFTVHLLYLPEAE